MQTAVIQMRRRVPPGPQFFDTQTTFSQILTNIGVLCNLKQTKNVADYNLFGGLRVNTHFGGVYDEAFSCVSTLKLGQFTLYLCCLQ